MRSVYSAWVSSMTSKMRVTPPPCDGRHEYDGGKLQELQGVADLLHIHADRAVVLFEQIPLVDHDDAGNALVEDEPGDLRVLFGYPLLGIDEQKGDIAAIERPQGFDDAVLFQRKADPALPADARRVDEDIPSCGRDTRRACRWRPVSFPASGSRCCAVAQELVDQGDWPTLGRPTTAIRIRSSSSSPVAGGGIQAGR